MGLHVKMPRLIVPIIISALSAIACGGKRVPQRRDVVPGMAYISWVFMSGDQDNPDRDFHCQSEPRTECVIPASHSGQEIFADLHFYYHRGKAKTSYRGAIDVEFFDGSLDAHRVPVDIMVRADQEISNQSVIGIVTSTRGTYTVSFDVIATSDGVAGGQPIRDQVTVSVR